jgi:hypothetical protein
VSRILHISFQLISESPCITEYINFPDYARCPRTRALEKKGENSKKNIIEIRTVLEDYEVQLIFRFLDSNKMSLLLPSTNFNMYAVEGPWVPLMLGDAPSLLEHLESSLNCFVCVFFLPDPSSSRSLIVVADPSTLLSLYFLFVVGFSLSFTFGPSGNCAFFLKISPGW